MKQSLCQESFLSSFAVKTIAGVLAYALMGSGVAVVFALFGLF